MAQLCVSENLCNDGVAVEVGELGGVVTEKGVLLVDPDFKQRLESRLDNKWELRGPDGRTMKLTGAEASPRLVKFASGATPLDALAATRRALCQGGHCEECAQDTNNPPACGDDSIFDGKEF